MKGASSSGMRISRRIPNAYVFLVVSALLGVFGCSSKDYASPKDLNQQFVTFFGFSPPPDVQGLKARRVRVRDTLQDWLSFRCGPQTFERVVRSNNYAIVARRDWSNWLGVDGSAGTNAPEWWPKQPRSGIETLYGHQELYVQGKTTQAVETYLWRDEKTGSVFAYYSAWN